MKYLIYILLLDFIGALEFLGSIPLLQGCHYLFLILGLGAFIYYLVFKRISTVAIFAGLYCFVFPIYAAFQSQEIFGQSFFMGFASLRYLWFILLGFFLYNIKYDYSLLLRQINKVNLIIAVVSIIAFFVMHSTIHSLLIFDGVIKGNEIVKKVVEGTLTNVCGQVSLQMGVFGGIIVGLGVSYLHNRFYQIQLPDFLSFFEGERFIPIISTIVYILVGFLMFYIWPTFQDGIFKFGQWIASSGYGGTFVYGIVKRALVPFGLHHVFYMPFYQTAIGGTLEVNGVLIDGAQNIFFAQLADPNLKHFSVEATKYFSGEYMIMMFGLPGAALAMYRSAKDESKKVIRSLFLSAALTSMLTGITEPIEFAFIFVAPMLFVVDVFLAGTAFVLAHVLKVTIGFTFSCGLIDFLVFGVLQGNSKTHWVFIIVGGVMYFFLYYFSFRFLIKKFDLKTPGREDDNKLTIFNKKKMDYSFDQSLLEIGRASCRERV